MNRYELHQVLKEAEKKGYEAGRNETLRAQSMVAPSRGYNLGIPMPPDPSINGKYRCKVEWLQCPDKAAYEVRATLLMGKKFYNAIQVISYQTWEELRRSDSFKDYIHRWLDGAYIAMWKEFKKDVLFEFPNLDSTSSLRW